MRMKIYSPNMLTKQGKPCNTVEYSDSELAAAKSRVELSLKDVQEEIDISQRCCARYGSQLKTELDRKLALECELFRLQQAVPIISEE